MERTIYYDKTSHLLMCIMKDITEEERAKDEKNGSAASRLKSPIAVETDARRSEIASLLGDYCRNRVALSKLKNTLKMNDLCTDVDISWQNTTNSLWIMSISSIRMMGRPWFWLTDWEAV